MTASVHTALPMVPDTVGAVRRHLFIRLLTNPSWAASVFVLFSLVLAGVLAGLLTSTDPNAASAYDGLAPNSAAHPLGADSAGRDVLARLLHGTRFSLAGAALSVAIAMSIGVTSGLIAGYARGWFDSVSSWVSGLVMALPGVVVLLAARSVLGSSMWILMAIFGAIMAPSFHRLVYASVAAVRNELYVDAARVAGLSDLRIITRHILTVVRAPVIIQSAMIAGIAISVQAGLELVGVGDMTIPTWGGLLNEGFTNIYRAPLLTLWPSLAIVIATVALTLLANATRDELERTGAGAPRRQGIRNAAAASLDVPKTSTPIVRHPESDNSATSRSGSEFGPEILRVCDLSVGYNQQDASTKTVVHDVSLTIRRGEVHGLIGESGSGKTQTAWSILGLLPAAGRVIGGAIVFDGVDLARADEKQLTAIRGRRIGYIPQEPMSNLDPSFTIGSQLVEPMRTALGITKNEAKQRVLALLARVGIPHPDRTFAAYPHEISGGMAQRVLIAGAVSCKPDLLIADEPTTALDVTVQAEVLDLLRDLREEFDMGVLIVTHNFGVVADLCDRLSVMRSGRIVETGPVRSVFASPQHAYTRDLFGAILDEEHSRGAWQPPTLATATEGVLR
ncbi:dipeptide/oligopeptide/nickel ABC transporter permease/ATP-binding protein [Pseudarthrobacter sp. NPDC058329]|uniref:dipeptide/oligopeptide/nickel ABC transporter permease/ATP-binding protein n=1 Tax=Pseudarthrobacter sp. NPDC058329 TaxID=3346448 RepID=UPI0036DF078C